MFHKDWQRLSFEVKVFQCARDVDSLSHVGIAAIGGMMRGRDVRARAQCAYEEINDVTSSGTLSEIETK